MKVSAVVVAQNGERALEQCVASLLGVEVIVVDQCGVEAPGVQMIRVDPNLSLPAARAAGFDAASGEILASAEDRYFFRADWAGEVRRMDADVVAGPVDPFPGLSLTGWAMFLSDYRSQPAGRGALRGGNVAYRRSVVSAVEMAKTQWDLDYHEALQRSGAQFAFNPNMVAYFAYPPSVLRYASEKFALSRSMGRRMARGAGAGKRVRMAVSRMALPPVLLYRIGAHGREYKLRYVLALPWMAAFSLVQTVGEMAGLLAGDSRNPT